MSTIDPSAIDPTKPETGEATTASVRANEAATQTQLQNAKNDVGALETSTAAHYADSTIHFTATSVDHGSIQGLADDDHLQYHTDARGDARYPPVADTPQINRTDMPTGPVNMAVVASLPGTPDSETLYFVTT